MDRRLPHVLKSRMRINQLRIPWTAKRCSEKLMAKAPGDTSELKRIRVSEDLVRYVLLECRRFDAGEQSKSKQARHEHGDISLSVCDALYS